MLELSIFQLEQKRAEELAAKQASKKPVPTPAPPKVSQDRVPNGMVRITHNPLTNSAVITPLYGPLEPNPSYLQQPLGLSQPVKLAPPSNPLSVDPPRPNLASVPKTSSNSVQQQASVSGLGSSTSTSSQPQQMVTIRRVMQPNLSEPVVTVTLKGETPGNDRVLFTLVNGQVLPTDKSNGVSPGSVNNASGNVTLSSTQSSSTAVDPASNTNPPQSKKKQKKQEKKKQKKLLLKTASNGVSNAESLTHFPLVDQVSIWK